MSLYSFSAGRYGAPAEDKVRWPLAGRHYGGRYHRGRYKGGRRGHNRCGQEETAPRETNTRSHRREYQVRGTQPVLGIRDILVRIQIRLQIRDSTSDPTPFFSDFFFIFFSNNLPQAQYLQLKIKFFAKYFIQMHILQASGFCNFKKFVWFRIIAPSCVIFCSKP
jgi:hypothetical protein